MSTDQTEPQRDDRSVLPPVVLDPVLAEAVDDALAGAPTATTPLDPNRVLGADPHDFAGLYLRHRSVFALHARRYLRDHRDVDEVVQEAFLRLFLAMPELTSELQALAYCRRTITNLCIDRYRADQRRPRLVDLESVPVDVLTDDEPDDPVVQAEDAAIVREALALLTPLHREALVKREIEEKPLPQIAAELGVPEENVKHLLHRARRALRRRLVESHAARGLDVDDVSTLSLLARSAVSGGMRVGVLALLFLGLVLGASATPVPVVAYETISGLWTPEEEVVASGPDGTAAVEPGEAAVVVRPPGVLGADREYPGPITAPLATGGGGLPPLGAPAVVPPPGPLSGGTGTVVTRPSATPSAPLPVLPPAESTSGPVAEPPPVAVPSVAVPPSPVPSSPVPSTPVPPSAVPASAVPPDASTRAGDRSTEPLPAARPSVQPSASDELPRPQQTAPTGSQPLASENGPVRVPVAARRAS